LGRVSVPAAFLDRDGTLNVRPAEHEYITSARDFEWLPGATAGLARLAQAGYVLAVVSNQRGVARGLVTVSVLEDVEERIQRDLAALDCAITAFRYCFHDLDAGCDCRKPKPGLITRLADELELDLCRSWMIGDSDTDILAGSSAGCRTALVGAEGGATRPDAVAASLEQVSELVCSAGPQRASDVPTPDSNSAISA
jgi:D-glycero-D-manno-heptose 1,7-bisphosphate phosphatase